MSGEAMPLPRPIVVTGMYRTGSTRIYNILREGLQTHHPGARADHFGKTEELDVALEDPSPGIFKEHLIGARAAERIERGEVVAVATVREPMTTLVSLCATFGWPPEVALEETDRALKSLESVAAHAILYDYETATSGNPLVVRRIMREAGVPTSLRLATSLCRRWSRQNAERQSTQLLETGTRDFDKLTLLHPGHVAGPRLVDERTREELRRGAEAMRFTVRLGQVRGHEHI
jgi:hypothetical protein